MYQLIRRNNMDFSILRADDHANLLLIQPGKELEIGILSNSKAAEDEEIPREALALLAARSLLKLIQTPDELDEEVMNLVKHEVKVSQPKAQR
jgi:hypothetical protein